MDPLLAPLTLLSHPAVVPGAPDPAAAEGRSPHWPAVRAAHLKAEPACAACGGRDHPQVHHVYPFAWPGGAAHELDPANLVTLCESPGRDCHLAVGHLGDWHSRNPAVRSDAAAWLVKVRSRPYPGVG